MGVLEFVLALILVAVIVVLTIVLILETIEHRKAVLFAGTLQAGIDGYTDAFSSIAEAVKLQNEGYVLSIVEHNEMTKSLEAIWAVIEIHNRALALSPKLLDKDIGDIP